MQIRSVSLRNTLVNHTSLAALLDGGLGGDGIGELDGITDLELSGIDFASITSLEPLYAMDDLTDLWLVNTLNMDAAALDVLLDNLETIEGTDVEGVLYMTQADFDAFNADGGGLLATDYGYGKAGLAVCCLCAWLNANAWWLVVQVVVPYYVKFFLLKKVDIIRLLLS